jgi:hypothetical protein
MSLLPVVILARRQYPSGAGANLATICADDRGSTASRR